MTQPKAKKVFTSYGKYSNTVTYEYRGKRYDVEYSNDWTYCITPPKVQHENAQRRIDEEIERDGKQQTGKPVDLDEIWAANGWDD